MAARKSGMKAVCHVSEPTTIYMFRCTVEVTTYLHEMGKARHGRGYIEDVATPGDGLPFVLGGRLTRARGLLGCLGRRDRCPVQWLAATCRCCDDYAPADRPSLLLCLERASGEGCADMTRTGRLLSRVLHILARSGHAPQQGTSQEKHMVHAAKFACPETLAEADLHDNRCSIAAVDDTYSRLLLFIFVISR